MSAIRVAMEWWRAQAAARDLHEQLQQTPPYTAWRLPCNTSRPDDVIVARAVQILQQKYPGAYRVIWGAKSLSIYHTGAFQASIGDRSASILARWGLLAPPRSDSQGLHAPPAKAGGKAFPGEHVAVATGPITPEVDVHIE